MEIIDNEVCTNWSLTNKPDIPLSAAFQNNKIVIVNELCPTSRTDNTGLLDEQQWNLYCIHWIKGFIQQELRNSTLPGYSYSDSDNFINDFLQIENIGPDIKNDIQLESKRHILKLLYLGQDITVTEEAINQVIFAQHE
jgi:hypothetical protein